MREFDKTKKILPKNFSGDGVFCLEDDAFETVRQFNHQKYYIFPVFAMYTCISENRDFLIKKR